MKFQEAFDRAFDLFQEQQQLQKGGEGVEFRVTRGTSQILAFLWSMLAVAQNVLDDMAYIDDDNTIVSIPLKDSEETEGKKEKKTKKQTGQKSESTDDEKTVQSKEAEGSVDKDNEQEKQKEE